MVVSERSMPVRIDLANVDDLALEYDHHLARAGRSTVGVVTTRINTLAGKAQGANERRA